MTDTQPSLSEPAKPQSVGSSRIHEPVIGTRKRRRISWIWLVPLLAVLAGAGLMARTWWLTGPTVVITFQSADGLEIGQTKVRFKNVVVGLVTDINFSSDRTKVEVSVELDRDDAEYFTREGTRFWVVKPRLGVTGVSGLGTLLSGAYIGVDASLEPEQAGEKPVHAFKGLENEPEIINGRAGRRFVLTASSRGSLDVGSPVYYRGIPVGRIIGHTLRDDGQSVDIQVFVDAPYDQFVLSDTRFWDTSGVELSWEAAGFTVRTGSLATILAGGVEFGNLNEAQEKVDQDHVFPLFETQHAAMADPDGVPFLIELHFEHSVRGLSVGAPVSFHGLNLGKVVDIDLEFNEETAQYFVLVKAELYPLRFGNVYESRAKARPDATDPAEILLAPLVQQGLRAQLKAANLLTGQQYVDLEFSPDAKPVDFDESRKPMVLPTIPGSFDRLQQQISSIVTKIDAMPFQEMGEELRDVLSAVRVMVKNVDGQVTPKLADTLTSVEQAVQRLDGLIKQGSPLNAGAQGTMLEISNAAKALRSLADYIQANPTALLRGPAAATMHVTP
jgi:paraquat-inducible protein B